MKYVIFYDMAPDAGLKLMPHFPAHRARLEAFHARGDLLAAGPLGNPPTGAMGIFKSRRAAEDFVAGDPFVVQGLVASRRIVEWNALFL